MSGHECLRLDDMLAATRESSRKRKGGTKRLFTLVMTAKERLTL